MGTHIIAAMAAQPFTHIPALRLPLPSGEAAALRRRGGAGLSSVRSMTSAAGVAGQPVLYACGTAVWHSQLVCRRREGGSGHGSTKIAAEPRQETEQALVYYHPLTMRMQGATAAGWPRAG